MHNLTSTTVLAPSVDLRSPISRRFPATVLGQFAGAQAAARHMIEAGTGGSIINMCSIGGHGGLPASGRVHGERGGGRQPDPDARRRMGAARDPRQCDRAGVDHDRRAPRYDEKFPGVLDFDAIQERIPLGRFGEVEEIAAVAVFLASDASTS